MLRNAQTVSYIELKDIVRYENSARRHSRAKLAKLKKLIERYGQVVPIIIDDQHVIVDGHAVYEVLLALGYGQAAVIVVAGRTPPEIAALRLALNRIPQEARWDPDRLREEFSELLALSFDMDLTAFDTVEIDAVLNLDLPGRNVVEDQDEVPSPKEQAVSARGDVWTCGRHRIACGDALNSAGVLSLLCGERARMGFTDPPYNVRIEGFVSGLGRTQHREFVQASGEMTEGEFVHFLEQLLRNLQVALVDGALLFVCMDWRHIFELLTASRTCEISLENLCVWAKTNAGMGSLYRSQHELVAVFKNGRSPHLNNVDLGRFGRYRTNVWTYRGMNAFGTERQDLLQEHPTVKPVALVADAIRDVTRRNDAVVDLFLGSGTTLIAAEETGRRSFGMEIDPIYVDVAIRRWERVTGKDALRLSDGKTFADVAAAGAPEIGAPSDDR